MKQGQLQILVCGEAATGKSTICYLLKQFLREKGFEVELEPQVDFDYDEGHFDQKVGQFLTEKVERVAKTRKIVLKERQLQREAHTSK